MWCFSVTCSEHNFKKYSYMKRVTNSWQPRSFPQLYTLLRFAKYQKIVARNVFLRTKRLYFIGTEHVNNLTSNYFLELFKYTSSSKNPRIFLPVFQSVYALSILLSFFSHMLQAFFPPVSKSFLVLLIQIDLQNCSL